MILPADVLHKLCSVVLAGKYIRVWPGSTPVEPVSSLEKERVCVQCPRGQLTGGISGESSLWTPREP